MLLRKLLGQERVSDKEKVAIAETTKDDYGLSDVLAALELPRSTWCYHQKHVMALHRGVCIPVRATGGHRLG